MLERTRRIQIVFVVLLGSAIMIFVTYLVLNGRDARDSTAVASSHDTAASNSILSRSEVYAEAGRTHYGSGEFLLSAQSYAQAAAIDTENPRYHNDAGYSFWRCKDYDSALKHLEAAVKLRPSSLRYTNNLAILYVDIGRDSDAFSILSKTHRDDAVANYNLGYIYLKRRRRDEAIAHMETAISLGPDLELATRWLNRLRSDVEPDELKAAYIDR
ncbi:tetratricopeptide repeat protein [Rhodopirellula baltica]